MEVYARYDRATRRTQLLKDHCDSVGQLCSKACSFLGLSKLGLLAGLLHDGGKCSSQFQEYLLKGDSSQRGSINHSSFGAQFVAKEFADVNACTFEGITAALIAGASCGHHGGPFDYVNPRAKDELASRTTPQKDIHYDEVKQIFLAQGYAKDYLSNLFQCAVKEVENFS
ncbi:MAG: CRISPR-associated endonuclease Cas3'', partial [Raoultibacter sp.]